MNTKYLTAIPTAAVLFYSYLGTVNLPERDNYPVNQGGNLMATLGTRTATDMSWEDADSPDCRFISDDETVREQIGIIHRLVSKILEESQDLDQKYAKVVDKYFWDLA